MIGTNLCVWLHVLIQETKHQIMIILYPNSTARGLLLSDYGFNLSQLDSETSNYTHYNHHNVYHHIKTRSIDDHDIFTTHGICRRSNVIGELVKDASQFLFPCTIEYSLICAAILYVMWKHTDNLRYVVDTCFV
jgi:hypothetical protein